MKTLLTALGLLILPSVLIGVPKDGYEILIGVPTNISYDCLPSETTPKIQMTVSKDKEKILVTDDKEKGRFTTQDCVNIANLISSLISKENVIFYGYFDEKRIFRFNGIISDTSVIGYDWYRKK